MTLFEEGRKLANGLASLGARRLAILGGSGLFFLISVLSAAWFLNRPQYETLYGGLDPQESMRVAGALKDINVNFDSSVDGASISVEFGQAPRVRMILAERGLPRNSTAGYELFDKLGSIGLTSFMQEVTKVRALEGELARSILTFRGVKSARVHLALSDEGAFRVRRQQPSASVIVGLAEGRETTPGAIRHLVAAAVPGMTADAVTVLSADGAVLGAGKDAGLAGPARVTELERTEAELLESKLTRTLTPLLGTGRFKVSVVARINADTRQTSETIYNPEGRVERSVRTTKETQSSQNANSQTPASVERNIPNDKAKADGKSSAEDSQKKEELTNFEISSKAVTTTSSGYSLERLSVAILVDRTVLAPVGGAPVDASAVERRVSEISELAASAAGLTRDRGDVIKVSAAEFAERPVLAESGAGERALVALARQAGVIFNGLVLIGVAFGVSRIVVPPLMRAMNSGSQYATPDKALATTPEVSPQVALGSEESRAAIAQHPRRAGQKRLEQMVDQNEEELASVLKQWVRAGETI